MFVRKFALPRRTVLKGLGAALALPFLDAMVPALTAQSRTAVRKRLACVYIPHGVILDQWTPAASGADFEFKPILKPLEPFRPYVTVVTNLLRPEQGIDTNHAGAPASFLTGVPPKRTSGQTRCISVSTKSMRVESNHSSNAENESAAIRSVSGPASGGGTNRCSRMRASTIACAMVPASAASAWLFR